VLLYFRWTLVTLSAAEGNRATPGEILGTS
jgi:hypothetical protein